MSQKIKLYTVKWVDKRDVRERNNKGTNWIYEYYFYKDSCRDKTVGIFDKQGVTYKEEYIVTIDFLIVLF